MNKRFSKYKSEISESITDHESVNKVFRKILDNKEFKSDQLTTAFVCVLDCNENVSKLVKAGIEKFPLVIFLV